MPEPLDARRRVVVLVVASVAAVFMTVVTLAAVPPNPLSTDAAPATRRLEPFFAQNWQLFAPDPLNADRTIRFQGLYDDGGVTRRTEWLDWTDVELAVVRHRLVGGRAGYVANKLWALAQSSVNEAGAAGRGVVVTPTSAVDVPPASDTLERSLSAGVDPDPARRLSDYDRALTTLATQVLQARHPDHDLSAVRYELLLRPVVPYDLRHASDADRKASRTVAVSVAGGWRLPSPGEPDAAAAVRAFERRHR